MNKWIICFSMLCLIGCSPKKRGNIENDDEYIRPIYNADAINNAVSAVRGEDVEENANVEEINDFNNTSAQNIIMYSGMNKEVDLKKSMNCTKVEENSDNIDRLQYDNFNSYDDYQGRNDNNEELLNEENLQYNKDDYFNEQDMIEDQKKFKIMKELERVNNQNHYIEDVDQKSIKNQGNKNNNSNHLSEKEKILIQAAKHFKKSYKKVERRKNGNKKYCIIFKKRKN